MDSERSLACLFLVPFFGQAKNGTKIYSCLSAILRINSGWPPVMLHMPVSDSSISLSVFDRHAIHVDLRHGLRPMKRVLWPP